MNVVAKIALALAIFVLAVIGVIGVVFLVVSARMERDRPGYAAPVQFSDVALPLLAWLAGVAVCYRLAQT